MNKRTDALFGFKRQLVKMYDFINETGPKAQINLIDPEQVKFQELCYGIESSLEWLSQEIEKEEDKGCEFIDDTENLYRVGE